MLLKNNPIINLFRYTWRYSIGTKKQVIIFILLSIIANFIWLLEPIIIGRVFNSIQFSADDPKFLEFIIKNLLLLILITIGVWIFHGTSRVMETKNAFLVRRNYKNEMFNKVMDLPASWHKYHHSGDTIDKINKASENLFNFDGGIFQIVKGFTHLCGSIIILAWFDWKIALAAIFISIFVIWSTLKFDKKLQKRYKKIFKAENYLASAIHDYISNIITIITLRLKSRVVKEIDFRAMRKYSVFKENAKLTELKWFSNSFYISVMISGALIFSAYNSYKTEGVIVIGLLFMLYRYLSNIGRSFNEFALIYGSIVREDAAVVAAEIINKEYDKLPVEKKYYLPRKWNKIQIKNLSFFYKNKETKKGQLDNISLLIERNKKIALIGESGCGKSTTFSLLRGLHNPDSGEIFCDNKKLKNGLAHLYNQITLIPQEPEIFNSTVKENITMGVNVKKEKLDETIKMSIFNKVVSKLENGLDTNVMEKGVSLSGGEKQRLALARGLLRAEDAEFLFLDEPTSSVDSHNEMAIYENILKKFKDKTIIAAFHRLNLLQYFDYIYYFKNGKIIAQGKFIELLKNKDFKIIWENYNKQDLI
ncbi:MAG: ABC transporter ATP-binding protein [Patescibacteria group bacterium]|nr:ABC transporter ATP-binding protein [Patescibacteria group bacterium]